MMSNEEEEILQALGGMTKATHGKYLGLPLVVGRAKKQVFAYIRERTLSKIQGWKGKSLKQAGKETLLKAVILALPGYTMNCFRLPKGICGDFCSAMARFWWSSSERERKMHWIKWEKLAECKGNGGLGLRDLEAFNTALLAKQLWRFISKPNLLVSKVLKARYYPRTSLMDAKPPNNASWMWKSFSSAKELIQKGMRIRVGDGDSIFIWSDSWITNLQDGRVFSSKQPDCQTTKVKELMCDLQWNLPVIRELFHPKEVEAILNIPISIFSRKDRFYWCNHPTGSYTVKTGYRLALGLMDNKRKEKQDNGQTSRDASDPMNWKVLWGLNIKNKHKIFLWKCLHFILPTGETMQHRLKSVDSICRRCGVESQEHLFFFCPDSVISWKLFPIDWRGLEQDRWHFRQWWNRLCTEATKNEDEDLIGLTVIFLWQLWKCRNKWHFEGIKWDPHEVVQRSINEWNEYISAQRKETSGRQLERQQIANHPNDSNFQGFTFSVATSTWNRDRKTGRGIVIDHQKELPELVWAEASEFMGNNIWQDALIIRTALCLAKVKRWDYLLIRTSNLHVLTLIQNGTCDESHLATIMQDIFDLVKLFSNCKFGFVRKECNKAASSVANFASSLCSPIMWERSFTLWLVEAYRNSQAS